MARERNESYDEKICNKRTIQTFKHSQTEREMHPGKNKETSTEKERERTKNDAEFERKAEGWNVIRRSSDKEEKICSFEWDVHDVIHVHT